LFEDFWAAYPKKKAKDDARRAWDKRRPDGALLLTILAALQSQVQSPDWQKDDGRYIPFPATWLNRGQWTDVPSTRPASVPLWSWDDCPHSPKCGSAWRCDQTTKLEAARKARTG